MAPPRIQKSLSYPTTMASLPSNVQLTLRDLLISHILFPSSSSKDEDNVYDDHDRDDDDEEKEEPQNHPKGGIDSSCDVGYPPCHQQYMDQFQAINTLFDTKDQRFQAFETQYSNYDQCLSTYQQDITNLTQRFSSFTTRMIVIKRGNTSMRRISRLEPVPNQGTICLLLLLLNMFFHPLQESGTMLILKHGEG